MARTSFASSPLAAISWSISIPISSMWMAMGFMTPSLVGSDRRINRAVNQNDLPLGAVLLKHETVGALHLVGSFNDVVKAGPAARVPVARSQIRDAEFPRRVGREKTIDPNRSGKMMSVFVEPHGIGRDGFLKECGVFVVERRHHRSD